MRIVVVRTDYTPISSTGVMLVDGSYFGVTLEDRARHHSEPKVYGKTCFAPGHYPIKNTMSPRFKKLLPEIFGVPQFEKCRIHGGNDADDTEGCVLVARQRLNLNWILGSLSDKLVKMIDQAGGEAMLEVIAAYPYYYRGG